MLKIKFYKKLFSSNARIYILLSFFVFLGFLVLIRLFYIQIISHQKYKKLANNQHWILYTIPAKRGNIYSSDGFMLVGTQNNYLLFAEPNKIKNKSEFAQNLAQTIFDLKKSQQLEYIDSNLYSYETLYNKYLDLIENNLLWVGLEKNISPLEKEFIESKKILHIGFEDFPIRYYPEESLASHVLGFVASNNAGEDQGYFGIEGKFNEDLKGRAGRIIQEKDALGNPILVGAYKQELPIFGRDIYLTINRTAQYLVEQKLKEGVNKFQAKSGSVIVMDPFTGEVIAMANFPSYHPSDFNTSIDDFENDAPYRKVIEKRNVAISDTYEPGSVIKPLTVAVALDLNLMTPQTTFQDDGPVWYYEYKIDNWDGKHHGTLNLIQLLQKSNNIGAAWVGHKIGSQDLHKYLYNFGISSKTGIDLEGEESGTMPDNSAWTDIGLANISFGQGLSATALQVLNSFNSLINGGNLLEPKIISKIKDTKDNSQIFLDTKVKRRVISEETSNTMINVLEQSALGGEAKYFVLKNYKIAGKTGTAQIPVNGTYDPKKTNATFVGYLSGSKKFSMIVKLQEPQTSTYASETAVPLWMDIAKELINFYNLPPDKN